MSDPTREEYTPTTDEVRAEYVEETGAWRNVAEGWFDRWLASVQRAARAEGWDEGLDAGRDRWMDAREFGEPPVNPYTEEGRHVDQ